MASLIPILQDLIPILLPSEVHITKSSDLDAATPTPTAQTDGMVRKAAIVNQSDKICASVMLAHPHTSSAIHHHGEQDTIVYAASGHGAIISHGGQRRHALAPGDFALIPAWLEHQEVNEGEEEVRWIITRSGGSPVVVNLVGWGRGEMKV